MAKAKPKTTETGKSVAAFIKTIEDETKREDSRQLVEIMAHQTGYEAKMWGTAIIGFGSYHYKYESGHEGDAPLLAFSPRKAAITLYVAAFEEKEALLQQLGKHKAEGGCVYIKKLEDVDLEVLKKIMRLSVKFMQKKHGK
ncbi:DUF1801 domain-containing protein [Deminuibacter soli]|uniref:DUF1801 domain-containing protein n=1 Tax=Deminuibacter soli TaxID=2291815 RepID=A0A3E1NG28_9BACT|nr:DUF1801 domain-containing protein [Deminuibacter soli]RFM26920.1 DUF1801 domain-containing protein [Deminuibacter soli]